MAVKGTLNLAGRQYREVVAKLFRSDQVADRASGRRVAAVLFDVVEFDLVEVHDGFHASTSQ